MSTCLEISLEYRCYLKLPIGFHSKKQQLFNEVIPLTARRVKKNTSGTHEERIIE